MIFYLISRRKVISKIPYSAETVLLNIYKFARLCYLRFHQAFSLSPRVGRVLINFAENAAQNEINSAIIFNVRTDK